MDYVRLTDVWPQNGLLSVILAALEDAAFHPVIECDQRGWMHFYLWPRGSSQPVTVWIPEAESMEATAFLEAASALPWEPSEDQPSNFWAGVSTHRRLIYAAWLLEAAGFGPLIALAAWYAAADCPDAIHGQPY